MKMKEFGPRRRVPGVPPRMTHCILGNLQGIFLIHSENLKKEDIVRSMFRTSTEILAQMSYIHALAFGVRRIYFAGSFISILLAREVITAEIEGRILLRPEVCTCVLSS